MRQDIPHEGDIKLRGCPADWSGVIRQASSPVRAAAYPLAVAVAGVVALGLVGPARASGGESGRDESASAERSPQPPPRPAKPTPRKAVTPSIVFVGIADGQAARRRLTFRVRLTGFSLSRTQTPPSLTPGQGFLHFSMDGGALDLPGYSANGDWAMRAGTQGRYSPAQSTSLAYRLPPGQHTLTVSLGDNFHAEIGVSASVTFTVR